MLAGMGGGLAKPSWRACRSSPGPAPTLWQRHSECPGPAGGLGQGGTHSTTGQPTTTRGPTDPPARTPLCPPRVLVHPPALSQSRPLRLPRSPAAWPMSTAPGARHAAAGGEGFPVVRRWGITPSKWRCSSWLLARRRAAVGHAAGQMM